MAKINFPYRRLADQFYKVARSQGTAEEWRRVGSLIDRNFEEIDVGGGNVHVYVAADDATARVKRSADFVCDGVNDDVEIQAAVTLAGPGGTVFLVGELFSLGATVTIDNATRIAGTSIRAAVIVTTFAGAAFQVRTYGVTIESLLIDTAGLFGGTVTTGAAISAVAAVGVNPSWLTVRSVETVTRSAAGLHIDGEAAPDGSQPGDYFIDQCAFFTTDTTDAVYVRNARHVYFTNSAVFGAGAGAPSVTIVKGASGTQGQAHNLIWMGGTILGPVTVGGQWMKFLGVNIGDDTVTLGADSLECFVVACILAAPVVDNGTDNTVALNVPESVTGDGIASAGTSVTAETSYGQASSVGAATTEFARADHTHGTPALPTPAAIGASEATHTHTDLTGELLMQDGVTNPPVPLTNEAGTDWLYEG